MPRVIISAGHTSRDPGATFNGLQEVTFTRKIANEIITELRKRNIITLSVPYELDLAQRIDWINKTGYSEVNNDIALEIHINDGGKTGIEAWYKGTDSSKSKVLAESIAEQASLFTGLTNQGAKSEFDHPLQSLAFVNQVYPIGVILECLYLDNPEDQDFLQSADKVKMLAEGIVDGIEDYYLEERDQSFQPVAMPSEIKPTLPRPSFSNFDNPFPTIGSFGVDRDGRRQMIEQTYQMILGKLPNMQEVNFFINSGVTQEALIKKMVESQEHYDMVIAARDIKEMKKQKEEMAQKVHEVEIALDDKTKIIENLNFLIEQKNQTIHNLEDTLERLKSKKLQLEEVEVNDGRLQQNFENSDNSTNYNKESRLDRLLNILNKIFG